MIRLVKIYISLIEVNPKGDIRELYLIAKHIYENEQKTYKDQYIKPYYISLNGG